MIKIIIKTNLSAFLFIKYGSEILCISTHTYLTRTYLIFDIKSNDSTKNILIVNQI